MTIYDLLHTPRQKKKVRLFEAFSGYGSQSLALKRYGIDFEHVGIAEIDSYAVMAHKALHGEVKNYGNITEILQQSLPDMDLFTYSFPCQDISVAGKNRGLDKDSGTRSSLLWECVKIIEAKQPGVLMMENVKNLVGKKHKPKFLEWLDQLDDLGYNNYWKIINAKWCGVPQNRERIFVVSIRKDIDDGSFFFNEDFDNGLRLRDVLESEVDEKYFLNAQKTQVFLESIEGKALKGGGVVVTNKGQHFEKETDYAGTLLARDWKGLPNQTATAVLVKDNTKQGFKMAEFEDAVDINHPNSKTRRGRVQKGVSHTIMTACTQVVFEPVRLGGIFDSEKSKHQAGSVWDKDGVSPCVDTMQGGYRQPMVIEEPRIKKVDIALPVRVRKHTVDLNDFVTFLRGAKAKKGMTLKEIAHKLNCPRTEVEHWFRNDKYISFPSEDRWYDLKALLGIESTKYDAFITEFEIKEGVFEKANRCYLDDGIAPTLTSSSTDEKVIVRWKIRKLTPRECFRLMGLTEDEIDKIQATGLSNTQQYKMAGNSIVVDQMAFLSNLNWGSL